jgi:hypothetical protein
LEWKANHDRRSRQVGPCLSPGTPVRYDGSEDGPEYGVVVHCWRNDEVQTHDCYIAFFGNEQPTGKPSTKPYVLRYLSKSLKVAELNRGDWVSAQQ